MKGVKMNEINENIVLSKEFKYSVNTGEIQPEVINKHGNNTKVKTPFDSIRMVKIDNSLRLEFYKKDLLIGYCDSGCPDFDNGRFITWECGGGFEGNVIFNIKNYMK